MGTGSWRHLSPDEWARHPLNRIWGWLAPIVVLLFIEGPIEGGMILAGALADFEMTRAVVRSVEPEWYGWLQLVVDPAAPLVLLLLMFLKVRPFPEIYLGVRGLSYGLAALAGGFQTWAIWWIALAQGLIIAAELALAVYLFLGDRPNVVFRRRVRARA